MTIPASELAAWSELAEKATARPWMVLTKEQWRTGFVVNEMQDDDFIFPVDVEKADARYMEAAANALPRLLSAYSQSQARVAELEKAIDAHRRYVKPLCALSSDRDLWSVLPQSEGASE